MTYPGPGRKDQYPTLSATTPITRRDGRAFGSAPARRRRTPLGGALYDGAHG